MKNLKQNSHRNDEVFTPDLLAENIVRHYNPTGKILEPCCGNGVFLKYMPNADWCEISKGRNFFECKEKYDWIITNPPWSIFRPFLIHALNVAENIVFLIPIVHYFSKARLREIFNNNYGIKEIIAIETPKCFPQMGFQLGIVYIQKNYKGKTNIIYDTHKKFTQQRLSASPVQDTKETRHTAMLKIFFTF